MARPTRRAALAAIGTAALLALTACSGGTGSTSPASTSPAASGSATASGPAALKTVTAGKLTVATGDPAYSPWMIDDDPSNGKGFESAVTYAVAKQLGYATGDVVWVRSTFDSAITPGAKPWDMNIQQFSITAERKKAVDFSSPYYTTSQALVAITGTKGATATSLATLKTLTVGVATGTTSYDTVNGKAANVKVFNSVDDTVQALKTKQIDAMVTDLSSALYIAGAQVKNGVVVAQFPNSSAGGDQLGFVLPKGSALTTPVSGAIDALRKSGELTSITNEWLSAKAAIPVLQ